MKRFLIAVITATISLVFLMNSNMMREEKCPIDSKELRIEKLSLCVPKDTSLFSSNENKEKSEAEQEVMARFHIYNGDASGRVIIGRINDLESSMERIFTLYNPWSFPPKKEAYKDNLLHGGTALEQITVINAFHNDIFTRNYQVFWEIDGKRYRFSCIMDANVSEQIDPIFLEILQSIRIVD